MLVVIVGKEYFAHLTLIWASQIFINEIILNIEFYTDEPEAFMKRNKWSFSISIALELNDEIWDKFCIFQSKGEYITVLASAVFFLDCPVWPQEILIEED